MTSLNSAEMLIDGFCVVRRGRREVMLNLRVMRCYGSAWECGELKLVENQVAV